MVEREQSKNKRIQNNNNKRTNYRPLSPCHHDHNQKTSSLEDCRCCYYTKKCANKQTNKQKRTKRRKKKNKKKKINDEL